MAITTTSLGRSYLHQDELPLMLRRVEDYVDVPYADSKGIPTIGIGIALQNETRTHVLTNNLALVLRKLGVFAASDASAPPNETTAQRNQRYQALVNGFAARIQGTQLTPGTPPGSSASERALKAALDAELALIPGAPAEFRFASEAQAKEVKIEYILGYNIGPFSDVGAERKLDLLLDGLLAAPGEPVPHDTREYKALMSLYFNNPILIGPGLRTALIFDDRAEAWFEIRYNTNKEASNAVARRRYYEAAVFGLYENPSGVTQSRAEQTYRMLQLHRDRILTYERSYSAQILVANSTSGYGLNGTPDVVSSLDVTLLAAHDALIDGLRTQYASLSNLIGMDYASTNIYLDPGRDNSLQAVDVINHSSFLNAAKFDANGAEIATKDILIGEGGADYLLGGKGDDILIGGLGDDYYYFRTGDGNDRIIDQGRRGWIVFNDTIFNINAAGVFVQDPGNPTLWRNSTHPNITLTQNSPYTLHADGLNVDLGADFQSGDFGIRLMEDLAGTPVTTNTIQHFSSQAIIGSPVNDTAANDRIVITDAPGMPSGDIGNADNVNFDWNLYAAGQYAGVGSGGDDWITARGGRDVIYGGAGNDLIETGLGGYAPELYVPPIGSPFYIEGTLGGDIVHAAAGNDRVYGNEQVATAQAISEGEIGGSSTDRGDALSGGAGDDLLVGTADQDLLSGGAGQDVLVGGAGNDYLLGDIDRETRFYDWWVEVTNPGTEARSYQFHGSNELTVTAPGNDVLYGGDGDDVAFGGAGDDFIDLGAGNDHGVGGEGSDALLGGEGADLLVGDAADDLLDGGGGDDTILGGDTNDFLIGGTGNDVLTGGGGKDTYVYNLGDGVDTIIDSPADSSEASVLLLGLGITRDDITLGLGSLMISIGQGGALHFEGFDSQDPLAPPVLDSIQFADGSTMSYQDILDQGFDLAGTAGDDVIEGTVATDRIDAGDGNDSVNARAGNDIIDGGAGSDVIDAGDGDDTLIGGAGADFLTGGTGDDLFVANFSDGDVVIDQGGTNTLQMAYGGAVSALTVLQAFDAGGLSYLALVDGAGGQVSIQNGFAGSVSNFDFGGGVTVTRGELMRQAQVVALVLAGGAANEHFIGSNNADTIDGGAGADTLEGGAGNDTYVVDDAGDVVIENPSEGTDTVQSSIAYALGAEVENLALIGAAAIDGTGNALNNALTGNAAVNTLDGGAGNDTLAGGFGADTYFFASGTGQETIQETDDGSNAVDKVRFAAGVAPADIAVSRTGNNLVLTITATGDKITVANYFGTSTAIVEQFHFDDGTVWTEATIAQEFSNGTPGNDFLFGTTGNDVLNGLAGNDSISGLNGDDRLFGEAGLDTLEGGSGADILDGGASQDNLNGGSGGDTYVFARGYGLDVITESADPTNPVDRVLFAADILPADLTARRRDVHLDLTVNGTADGLTLVNYFVSDGMGPQVVEQLRFGDGTIWDVATVKALVLVPTEGNDVLFGYATNDLIDGAGGADILNGFAGSDTLLGGADNDWLSGWEGDDSLDGGAGADNLDGMSGGDTYVFARGYGQDVINENVPDPTNPVDRVLFTADILPADVTARRVAPGGPNDALELTINGTADKVTINSYFFNDAVGTRVVEELRFGDGTVWDVATVKALVLVPTEGNDRLTGYATNDSIEGLGGFDTIDGAAGNDTLLGGAGGDSLIGGLGDDVLRGGTGFDTLSGGDGNDTYFHDLGEDADTIVNSDFSSFAMSTDSLVFGAGVLPSEVLLTRVGYDDLWFTGIDELYTSGSPDSVRVEIDGYFLGGASEVDEIRFADDPATVWTVPDVRAMLLRPGNEFANIIIGYDPSNDTIDGLGGNDSIEGLGGADTLYGGAGDDVLYGEAPFSTSAAISGGDTLDGGPGRDQLFGRRGNDIYVFGRGSGHDIIDEQSVSDGFDTLRLNAGVFPADVALHRVGNDLALTIAGDPAQAWVSLYFTLANKPIEQIVFNDGTTWDAAAIASRVLVGTPNAMTGTAGNDTFVVDHTGDTITEGANQGTDSVQSGVTFGIPANVENMTLTGILDVDGWGNSLNNTITGNAGSNWLDGGTGNDTLNGGLGDDTLTGSAGDDLLNGGAGNDKLNGGDGLTPSGTDTLIGGAGDDIYTVGYFWEGPIFSMIIETPGEGVDTVIARLKTYVLPANVENLIIGSNTHLPRSFFGNELDNVITVEPGTDYVGVIDGGAGADTMSGGSRYVLDNPGDVVDETDSSIDTVIVSFDYTLGTYLEGLELQQGSSALIGTGNVKDNYLEGNERANTLSGLDGDDWLFGAMGADTMIGGQGDDTYIIASFRLTNVEFGFGRSLGEVNEDTIVENAGEGVDTVYSLFNYTLADTLENLVLLEYTAGSIFPLQATGNALANQIAGNSGANVIDGREGADTMAGWDGNDTYYVDDVNDVVTESDFATGGINDLVVSQVSYALGTWVENLTLVGANAVAGSGNELNNRLDGSQSVTANVLAGGLGDDTYIVGAGDTIVENAGEGTDTVQSGVSYTLGANVENLVLLGSAAISGTGDALDNTLDGSQNSAANTLAGGLGNDTYIVDGGDVVVESAGEGIDAVTAAFSYTLSANLENLTLTGVAVDGTGNADDNLITGNGFDNLLDGSGGADTLRGHWGGDTYVVDNTGDVIDETDLVWGGDAGGLDTVRSTISYALGSDLEDLVLIGTAAIAGTGNALDNVLTGSGAANVLDGGGGNDVMTGGAGNDTYRFARGSGSDAIFEDDATPGNLDTIEMAADILPGEVSGSRNGTNLVLSIAGTGDTLTVNSFFASVENEVERVVFFDGTVWNVDTLRAMSAITGTSGADTLNGTTGDDQMFGLAGNDTLNGLAGNDLLDGGTGIDTMVGSTGDDTYVVDNTGDIVTESSSTGGIDTVLSSVTRTLGTNQENLTLTGTSAINGTGNTLNNVIIGNSANNTLSGSSGNDTLDGGAGSDSLSGGTGNDTYFVSTGDTVTEASSAGTDTVFSDVSWTLGSNIERLTLLGTANVNATGNTLANVLTGNSGNNTLSGGTGADTMIGGAGDDIYVRDNTGDVITELAGEGIDTVQSSLTYTLAANVENLTLTATTAINGTGNALNNVLTGGSGVNVLTGLGGNDIYFIGTGDTVTEAAGGGEDLVNSSITLTLGSNVEHLVLTGTTAINGTGNTLNNFLRGNSAVNTLAGAAGNDMLEGGGGNDTLSDTGGINLFSGQAGTDTLTGNTGNEIFVGGAGNDTLNTGAGADILAFNRGDGTDTVAVSTVKDNSVSLGGGIAYADLFFEKSGNNLVLKTAGSAATEGITFTNWYAASANHSVLNMQMIVEASADFDAGSADPLRNRKVAEFNFDGLVNAFDAARVANPALTSWALTDALVSFHLGGSDTAALGGDLAYQQGRFGNLANVGTVGAQNVLAGSGFGSAAQTFQPLSSLQEGITRLS